MSINEMECKVRELRQLQALIDEATAEAEAIKDAIKAAMGDAESVQAGEYKNHVEGRHERENRHRRAAQGAARCRCGVHPRDHNPPLLRRLSVEKRKEVTQDRAADKKSCKSYPSKMPGLLLRQHKRGRPLPM